MQTVTVTATGVSDPTIHASSTVSVTPVTVTMTPTLTSLSAGQSQQLTAVVTDTANQTVSWKHSPVVGTLSAAGMYTAPATIGPGA